MRTFSDDAIPGLVDSFPLGPGKELKFTRATAMDRKILKNWAASLRGEMSPIQRDALLLATLAFRRWGEARARQEVANSFEEIEQFVQDNPHAEVPVLIAARLQRIGIVGLCHFRRTWCNNIFIDFLVTHPLLAAGRHRRVRGVGTAMLYYITCIAEELGAGAIWGEATQNSARFYARHFGRENIQDLFYVTRKEYTAFRFNVHEKAVDAQEDSEQ